VGLVWRDSQSRPDVTIKNVTELIDKEKAEMIFGGSSSAVAIAAGKVCQAKGVPFFATLSYSTETTGTEAHRYTFRECYNSWMSAKALSYYLKDSFPGKRYMYITADYTWGHTTEASLRKFTNTENKKDHRGILTPFPGAVASDFKKALFLAQSYKPDLLVLVLFGKHMEMAIRLAEAMGIKESTQIIVPNLTLSMAEAAGPDAMEGVLGTVPWCWKVPYQFDYHRGKVFVEAYAERYYRYPSTSGASAYTILYEYKAAVERANSFESIEVVKALEENRYRLLVIKPLRGHEYSLLKDRQVWRKFDHQSLQTVYVVKGKQAEQVRRDRFELDYFEIIGTLSGEKAVRTREEWVATRVSAGKSPHLEPLPGE
jgi:branched-chain amino acid transport system substrate-binding protein